MAPIWALKINRRTCLVTSVEPGGPADAAGITVGDRIFRVNDVDVDSSEAIFAEIKKTRVGHRSVVMVLKADGETQIETSVMSSSVPSAKVAESPSSSVVNESSYLVCGSEGLWGGTQMEPTAPPSPYWGFSMGKRTSHVKSVVYNGPAYKAGIRVGHRIVSVSGVKVDGCYEATLAEVRKSHVGRRCAVILEGETQVEAFVVPTAKPLGSLTAFCRDVVPDFAPLRGDDITQDRAVLACVTTSFVTPSLRALLPGDVLDTAFAALSAPFTPYWGMKIGKATAVVKSVERSGPASKAGISVGDRLLRINGVDVDGNYEATQAQTQKSHVGYPATVTLLKSSADCNNTDTTEQSESFGGVKVVEVVVVPKKPPLRSLFTFYRGAVADFEPLGGFRQDCAVVACAVASLVLPKLPGDVVDVSLAILCVPPPPVWGMKLGKSTALVKKVDPDGPADKAGISVNDRLLNVGGVKVDGSYEATLAEIKNSYAGRPHTVAVLKADGTTEVETSVVPSAKVVLPARSVRALPSSSSSTSSSPVQLSS